MGDSGVSLFTSKTLESAEEEKSINNRTPQPTHFLTEKFACHNFQFNTKYSAKYYFEILRII